MRRGFYFFKRPFSRKRLTLLLLRTFTALLGTLSWIWFSGSITGAKYEYALHDAMVRLRGPITPPSDILVVALDEETQRVLNLPLDRPIPRSYHARMLKKLAELGARRVVFDIVFAGESASPEADAALAQAVGELPVVLAVDHEMREVGGREIHELIKPEPFLTNRAASLAIVGMQIDDGVARHFLDNRDENTKDFVTLSEAGAGILKPSDRAQAELPRKGDLINFYGPALSIRTISLYQLLEEEVPIPQSLVKDKVVYVGLVLRTGLGVTQKDSFETPFGKIFGVEIHATQAANLMEKSWVRGPGSTWEYALGGVVIFSILMVLLRVTPIVSITLLTIIVLGWYLAAYIAVHFNIFLAGGSAVSAIMPLAVIISATYWYLRTYKKSQEIEKAFSLYLAPAMVAQLKRNPSLLKLGGEEIFASAMFTDIAGFTGISERLGPTKVTAMLNAYFTELGQIILEEDGTLIKFIGDAVFAIWGAPLKQEDHAARACRAALRIQQVVEKFNGQGDFPKLITRVGVHTGKMVVGNLGSNKRFDFTAIGDAVNLASRVEGVNKYLGTTVLATEDALGAARASSNFEAETFRMGAIKVVGREEPVYLHRLSRDPLGDATLNNIWNEALDLFARKEWDQAAALFRQVEKDGNGLQVACELYLSNLENFKANSPEADWKGELSMEHK